MSVCGIAVSVCREFWRADRGCRGALCSTGRLRVQLDTDLGEHLDAFSTGSSQTVQDRQYLHHGQLVEPKYNLYNCRSERHPSCHLGDRSRGHVSDLLQMDDTGFNVTYDATYTLPDLPDPPVGWQTCSFPVNANSPTISHGLGLYTRRRAPGTDAEWSPFLRPSHRSDEHWLLQAWIRVSQ